jgi:hypothetical protein
MMERQAMGKNDRLGLIDIGTGHRLAEIFLQKHLQPEEQNISLIRMAPRLDIGGDATGAWRILKEMAELIAVGIEDQVGQVHRIPPESNSMPAALWAATQRKDVRELRRGGKGQEMPGHPR